MSDSSSTRNETALEKSCQSYLLNNSSSSKLGALYQRHKRTRVREKFQTTDLAVILPRAQETILDEKYCNLRVLVTFSEPHADILGIGEYLVHSGNLAAFLLIVSLVNADRIHPESLQFMVRANGSLGGLQIRGDFEAVSALSLAYMNLLVFLLFAPAPRQGFIV